MQEQVKEQSEELLKTQEKVAQLEVDKQKLDALSRNCITKIKELGKEKKELLEKSKLLLEYNNYCLANHSKKQGTEGYSQTDNAFYQLLSDNQTMKTKIEQLECEEGCEEKKEEKSEQKIILD